MAVGVGTGALGADTVAAGWFAFVAFDPPRSGGGLGDGGENKLSRQGEAYLQVMQPVRTFVEPMRMLLGLSML
jgi:hypothetical protein